MTAKLDPFAAAPSLMKEWYRTSRAVAASLEPSLVHLVEIRASQINGCANLLPGHAPMCARRDRATKSKINAASRLLKLFSPRRAAAI